MHFVELAQFWFHWPWDASLVLYRILSPCGLSCLWTEILIHTGSVVLGKSHAKWPRRLRIPRSVIFVSHHPGAYSKNSVSDVTWNEAAEINRQEQRCTSPLPPVLAGTFDKQESLVLNYSRLRFGRDCALWIAFMTTRGNVAFRWALPKSGHRNNSTVQFAVWYMGWLEIHSTVDYWHWIRCMEVAVEFRYKFSIKQVADFVQ